MSEEEARELGEVADFLREDGFDQPDEAYWAGLQQRIVNTIDVTPLPGARRSGVRSGSSSFLGDRFRVWLGRAVLAAATAGVVLFVITMTDTGGDGGDGGDIDNTVDGLQTGIVPSIAPDDSPEVVDVNPSIEVPEELWEDGFMENALVHLDGSELDAWDEDYEAELYTEQYYYHEPFDASGGWGLDDLTAEELAALDDLFEG